MEAQRLNPLDAAWLFTESRATPNHVGGLLQFRLPDGAPRDYLRRMMHDFRHHRQVALDAGANGAVRHLQRPGVTDQPVVRVLAGAVERHVQALHAGGAQARDERRGDALPRGGQSELVGANFTHALEQRPDVVASEGIAPTEHERSGAALRGSRRGDDRRRRPILGAARGIDAPGQERLAAGERQPQVDPGASRRRRGSTRAVVVPPHH